METGDFGERVISKSQWLVKLKLNNTAYDTIILYR